MAHLKPIAMSTIIDPDNVNLAEYMSDDELAEMGTKLKHAFDIDYQSRYEWEKNAKDCLRLAVQYKEKKSFPWPGAANVKFPLLTTAAMQFAARAYPNIVVGRSPVRGRVIGEETPELNKIVAKIGTHMSYQLMDQNPEWEEEMDRMMVILPIVGVCFKKTFYDSVEDRIRSQVVLPQDLIINYWAKHIHGYTRKHHVIEMTKNDIYTRTKMGMFLEVDLPEPRIINFAEQQDAKARTNTLQMPSTEDETTPYKIIEAHCHWDLDQDGYREPYIVTYDYGSGLVLRVVPRFREDSITLDDKKKVVKIKPDEYFTKYGFIPNPDGSFYDLGFGLLLGPMNETVNTAINQALDQGTMYTTGGGFLGKGVRIKAGEYRLAPNEWKVVNATTDDLRKAIFPNPVKNPSEVSLKLVELLIEGGQKVASIADIFVGKMPGQNTPATTTMETVKQSSAVFTAIYKRVYRSFDHELKKIYKLNRLYLDETIDYPVELKRSDYENHKLTIIPTADPDVATDSEKLTKAKGLIELLQLGTINPQEVTKRVLEALRVEDIHLLMYYKRPPSEDEQQRQHEKDIVQMEQQGEGLAKQQDAEGKAQDAQIRAAEGQRSLNEKFQASQLDLQTKAHGAKIDANTKTTQAAIKGQEATNKSMAAAREAALKYNINEATGRQKLRHAEALNKEKVKATAAQAKAKPKPKSKPKAK